jgi:pimeloyl-ACP methyl ester carboxylesterase
MRAVTLIVLTLIALHVASSGCTSSTKPGPLDRVQPASNKPRAGNAYLLRGFIGVFSTGVDDLTRQINRSGVRAHVYQDDQWSELARTIAREYRAAPDTEPLVLIGHSYGADDVIRIARELDRANVPVDLLVTLDPVTPPPVPKNVRQALNIYQSNGAWDALPFLRGVPVRADAGFVGRLDNFDIKKDRRDLLEPGTDHFNIEKKGAVHEEVVGHVLITCPPRQTWLAARGKLPPTMAQQRDARLAGDVRPPRLDARSDSRQPTRQPKQLRMGPGDAQTAGHHVGN